VEDSTLYEAIERTPDLPWLSQASCGKLPLDQLNCFFVEAGKSISASTIAMCRRCPVRIDCLDHAYEHKIVSGYFGGMSPSRRRSLSHVDATAEVLADA
jgi:WhiB family transcriptional regulator, redox-sensing transcriptional regulator